MLNYERRVRAKLGAEVIVDSGFRRGSDIFTKESFGDIRLELEFMVPKGSNSGIYVMGEYEVQILDSFGLEGENNECGGFYQQFAPSVNMCLPPLQWQTYDIVFEAPRFNGTALLAPARRSLRAGAVLYIAVLVAAFLRSDFHFTVVATQKDPKLVGWKLDRPC